jgi:hypothetical protein
VACGRNKDMEMKFKPTVNQLCTIADMTVAHMTPEFTANRLGVSSEKFREWREQLLAASLADNPSIAARPVPVERPGSWK